MSIESCLRRLGSLARRFRNDRNRKDFFELITFLFILLVLFAIAWLFLRNKPSYCKHVIPTTINFPKTVKAAIEHMNLSRVEDFINIFSNSYPNRDYKQLSGLTSQLWLLSEIKSTIKRSSSTYPGNASAFNVEHEVDKQSSIIARIDGTDADLSYEIVILSAHLDSSNQKSVKAPGADDNASGTAVILETLKVILETGFVPKRTVEFHWYADGMEGQKGSKMIAEEYDDLKVDVVGLLNLDMVGHHKEGIDLVSIITEETDEDLVDFFRLLVDNYLNFHWRYKACGSQTKCSDHASWTKYDYPAGSVTEGNFRDMKSEDKEDDTMANLNFVQIGEFIKLGIGFVVEMGEPTEFLNQTVARKP